MRNRKTVNVTVTLPIDLVNDLDQAVEGYYPSRSSAIQEAIRDLLTKLKRRGFRREGGD